MQSTLVELSSLLAGQSTLNFLSTLFGSVAMYMFSLYKGFEGTTPALRRLIPGRSDVFYDRLDFLVVALTGTIVGTIFFHPRDTSRVFPPALVG